jgi:hypothetical protein
MNDGSRRGWLRPFGDTGITVSAICMGGAQLGSMPELFGYDVTEEAAVDLVRQVMKRTDPVPRHRQRLRRRTQRGAHAQPLDPGRPSAGPLFDRACEAGMAVVNAAVYGGGLGALRTK